MLMSVSIVLRLIKRLFNSDNREVLAYHLFKAACFLKRYQVEQVEKSNIVFIGKALKHLERFNDLLETMLRRTHFEMPLSLPNLDHLNTLRNNIMNRLYPNIKERKTGSDILFSLPSIFSLEKQYDQIPSINKLLEDKLNPQTFKKESLVDSFSKPIRGSFAAVSFLLLFGVSLVIFSAVILLRVPTVGWTVDWTYISDNSAVIVLGIAAAWGALLFCLNLKGKNDFMRDFTLHNGFVMAFEIAMVVVGIILCIASFSPRPLEQPEYVPNVVAGCATLSGILAAFTGFWLTHIYSNASEQTKKWLSKRIAVVVPLIGFSLTVVLGGLTGLFMILLKLL